MNRELDGQFGDYQSEIYINGLSGVLPAIPMEFQELEARAQAVLSLVEQETSSPSEPTFQRSCGGGWCRG
jgi:hypothetical protein